MTSELGMGPASGTALEGAALEASRVLVVDFGAQYAQLIARRVRECHVYSRIVPSTMSTEQMMALRPTAIILSGGPSSVYAAGAPPAPEGLLTAGVPILGICYGFQLMVAGLGGTVARTGGGEYGATALDLTGAGSQGGDGAKAGNGGAGGGGGTGAAVLLGGLPASQQVWMSHGDTCAVAPPGFAVTARTAATPVAAAEDPDRSLYGVQFHPEVLHTEHGMEILRRFLAAAGCEPTWTTHSVIEEQTGRIRAQVGGARAICGLSGGVDSSVAAMLVHKAIGSQLTCIFVNNGVLRKNEFINVQKNLRDKLGLNIVAVDAGERFLTKLAGVTDPEKKRKIIGAEFIAVFDDEANRIAQQTGGVDWLVQGTLYPDVIESSSVKGPSQTIKSHHNVGGLPERMKLKLIEPLRDLFKDEVRRIGRDMGMPEDVLGRQPFPGPGLAVRILGEVTPERVALLQEADEIVVSEIKAAGLYNKIWQSFAVLLPVMSVGVMGDQRTYAYTAAVRAVHSEDGMTADWTPLPYEVLKRISSRIVNEVRGINRVVYDITSKPPGTIEWE